MGNPFGIFVIPSQAFTPVKTMRTCFGVVPVGQPNNSHEVHCRLGSTGGSITIGLPIPELYSLPLPVGMGDGFFSLPLYEYKGQGKKWSAGGF